MDKFLIRKDVYEDLIEKGYGKKDLSKLTKKQITDKNGHKRTVYVRNGEQPVSQNQGKAQDELSPEKKARYEEMLEKVKVGSDENALYVAGKGMLNKKDAIAHLEEKLGKNSSNETIQNKDKTEEYKENYLDAKNEAGKDIADENRVDDHSSKAINLNKTDTEKLYKEFDYISENSKGNEILNILYDENKALYKKLADMDVEYKKLNPEAAGKTFSFDLAQKFVEDAFNEYKKNHEVGKDRFAEMSIDEIKDKQQNLKNEYDKYYTDYKSGKNDGSKMREFFKKFDVYRTALERKSGN